MQSGSDLKARRKQPKTVLPVVLQNPFSMPASSSSSNVETYLPIIVLLFILHFVVTGNVVPAPIFSVVATLSAPVSYLLSHNSPPSGVSTFSDPRFLGTNPQHGLVNGKSSIPQLNKYIFPPIQDAAILKDVGYDKLFNVEFPNQNSNRKFYVYSPDFFDDLSASTHEDPKKEAAAAAAAAGSNMKSPKTYENAVKTFRSNGRKIYKGNENPEVVIVTSVNYEILDSSYLVKVIQNRVDYAHVNNYGVYARWAQEFLPVFQKSKNDLDSWSRVVAMREAMVAFPNAKWFWYIDETSLIMRDDIDIRNYILKPDALEPIILKDQPVLPPNGAVKTASNVEIDNLSLIITQTETDLNINGFIVKNDLTGRAILELWMDPLIRMYPTFRKSASGALAHILQWHPLLLSKTAIVPPRTINSVQPSDKSNSNTKNFLYQEGDLVINFARCKELGSCEKSITPFWDQIQLKAKKSS